MDRGREALSLSSLRGELPAVVQVKGISIGRGNLLIAWLGLLFSLYSWLRLRLWLLGGRRRGRRLG